MVLTQSVLIQGGSKLQVRLFISQTLVEHFASPFLFLCPEQRDHGNHQSVVFIIIFYE